MVMATEASVSNMGSLVQEQSILDAQLHLPTAHQNRWSGGAASLK